MRGLGAGHAGRGPGLRNAQLRLGPTRAGGDAHVAQNECVRRSAIGGRTKRQEGYRQ